MFRERRRGDLLALGQSSNRRATRSLEARYERVSAHRRPGCSALWLRPLDADARSGEDGRG
jgi:hypothetical protein